MSKIYEALERVESEKTRRIRRKPGSQDGSDPQPNSQAQPMNGRALASGNLPSVREGAEAKAEPSPAVQPLQTPGRNRGRTGQLGGGKQEAAPKARSAEPVEPVEARPSGFHWESRFEDRMGELYRPIISRLPDSRGFIAFVSPTQQAGVSLVAREFAQFLAVEAGHGTLLLDADTVRPTQFAHYKMICNGDINEVARGEHSLTDAVHVLGNTGLSLAALGQRSAGRTVLLNSPRTQGIMQDLRGRFDVIVADCPAPENSGGVAALCGEADVVVIVIQAGCTSAREAARLKERIEASGGQPIAVVWNNRGYSLPKWLARWV